MPNVGLFVRAGIADGDKEPYEFTDIDRTVAAGLSVSGKQWGRDDDTFGIAGVVNGISAGVVNGISNVHQAFLNAGGLGILVGDRHCLIPATRRFSRRIIAFQCLLRRSRWTISSSSIRHTTATGALFRCSVCECIRSTSTADRLGAIRSASIDIPRRILQ
jgi:hypothetical protein